MIRLGIFSVLIVFVQFCFAQSEWNLKKCIEYALQNNISVKKGKIAIAGNKINYNQSKESLLPSVSANASQNMSWGRNINPVNNTYIEQNVRSNQFGISTYITLFNGLQNTNTIKQNKIELDAGVKELEIIENNITLQVASQYLQILLYYENTNTVKSIIETTEKQLETTKIKYESGILTKNFVLELEAKLSSDKLDLISAQNSYILALTDLANILQLKQDEFKIEIPQIIISDEIIDENVESIFQKAKNIMPEIAHSNLKYNSSLMQRQIAKGGYYPTLSLNASMGTLVSNNFKEYYNPQTSYIPFGVVKTTNDEVLIPNVSYDSRKRKFSNQINDNLGKSIMLNLSIPIYSNSRNKNAVKQADLLIESRKLDIQQKQNELYSSITSAIANYKAAFARYKALEDALISQKNNHEFNLTRFESGSISSSDYIVSQKNIETAISRMVQGKYELVFRKIILDFYRGKNIEIN
ncbi:MAG: TolC family protein [Bacteroidia bacterium]|nr:TolC family protein [Bacteroidia bacterium]